MKVVVNATPLIALAIVQQLDLLHKMFDQVVIAESVYQEVAIAGENKIGSEELQRIDWIEVIAIDPKTSTPAILLGLDQGELDTILLAQSFHANWVIIDEKLGRNIAKSLGLPLKGTVGVLLAAFYADYLSAEQIIEILEALQNNGIRLSESLIKKVKAEIEKY